jgi:uncharacterized membrane-anchored protein YhcB (DUF1043 family)
MKLKAEFEEKQEELETAFAESREIHRHVRLNEG